jgi:hypothetical protein
MSPSKITIVRRSGRVVVLFVGLAIMGTAVLAVALTYKLVKKTCPLCKTAYQAQG